MFQDFRNFLQKVMLSLVSLCSAVFRAAPLCKWNFSSTFQSNLYLPLNTKSVNNYAIELLVKIGKILGLWCLSWEFLFPTARIRPPYKILPHVITLTLDPKLDTKLLQTFALVWNCESWILVVLSWAHEILNSRILRCPESDFCSNWVFVVHVLLVRASLWMCI
jgi:hypothetical protein